MRENIGGCAWRRVLWLLVGVLLMAASAVHAQGTRRVALLIGNRSYAVGALTYPPQDVEVMRAALLKIGFADKDIAVVLNADLKAMKRAVQELGRRAQGAEVALLYYSGHGAQALGQNWLLPVNADVRKEADYEIEALPAQAVLTQMNTVASKAGIVILDACRDNPVALNKTGQKGLGRMEPGDRTLVAFATAPNDTAADNGLYARTLAAELQKPGLELLDVFRNTTREVRRASAGKQVPRVSEVTLDEYVFLAGSAKAPTSMPTQYEERACVNGVCIELVLISAGEFLMGSPESERGHFSDEEPQHQVSVQSFLLGKYEVTLRQWEAVMGSSPSPFSKCGNNCPVERVSWDDAQEFIKKLNAATGRQYRLPSEAEWEYAARARAMTEFNTGNSIAQAQANFQGEKAVKVGSFAPNAFGLYDMHGNVWEWVQDRSHDSYKDAPKDGSAWEQGDDTRRVLRGGSWKHIRSSLRSARRGFGAPFVRSDGIGFRIARTF